MCYRLFTSHSSRVFINGQSARKLLQAFACGEEVKLSLLIAEMKLYQPCLLPLLNELMVRNIPNIIILQIFFKLCNPVWFLSISQSAWHGKIYISLLVFKPFQLYTMHVTLIPINELIFPWRPNVVWKWLWWLTNWINSIF